MGAGNSTGAGSGPTMSGNNSAPTNPYQPLQQGTNPYAPQPSQQGTNPYAQQPLQQAQAPPASMGGKGNLIRDLQQRGYGQQQQPPQQQQQQQQYYQQPQQQYYQQQPQYYQQPQQSWQPPQQQFNPYSQPFMSQFAPQRGYGGGRGRGGYPPTYMQQGGQAQQQPGGFLFPPPSPAPTPAPSPSPNMPVNEYKPGYAALRAAGRGG